MIEFLDGPAAGETLQLRRAPQYLRVVYTEKETDALDQLEDEPRPEEDIMAYQLIEPATRLHLLVRGKKAREKGGWWAVGKYTMCENQPPDEVMRDRARWQAWAREQPQPF